MMGDIFSGIGSSYPQNLTNVSGTLYFTAHNSTNGTELWKLDSNGNPVLVNDIVSGTGSSSPQNLTNVNGTLYFQATNSTNGTELWKLDSNGNPVLVNDIVSGNGSSYPQNLTNVNGTLYFQATNSSNGSELWKLDNNDNPVLVNDIAPGIVSSLPNNLTYENNKLYFWANNGVDGRELYFLLDNQNPTDLTLSATNINENFVANSVVGTLATTDPNAGDTFTYSLVPGIGSTDNSAFTINGDQLKINASPDFEAKSSYNLRVKTTDAGGLSYEKELTINVNNLNEAPTDLTLSATSINENVAANTIVGNLTSIDPDTGNTFTYSLVSGTGDTDNAAFAIAGDQLKINGSPDFETKSSYNLRIQTTDAGGLNYEKQLTVNVTDINEIIGGNGRDTLTSTNGDDYIDAGDGDDTLMGSLGADTLRGGSGTDRLSYTSSPTAVNVNLITGLGTGGHAEGDKYFDIENVDGSRFNDLLVGDLNNNTFYAGKGNDTLQGNGGNDYLNGENGNDSLVGGDGLDKLYGGSENDTLTGDAGNDTLYGGIGGDRLLGTNSTSKGMGESDRLMGDTGNDTFVLGNSTTSFYDDGNNANKGVTDYALIMDFNFADDLIELAGNQNYYLNASPINTPAGTGIFIDNDGVSGVSGKDELIGILESITTANGLAITSGTDGFSLLS